MKKLVIIAGFLSSGKTTLLRKYINNRRSSFSLYQCEIGLQKLEEGTRVKSISELVEKVAEDDNNHIYIEYNGTWNLGDFIGHMNAVEMTRTHIVYVMDLSRIYQYMVNFPDLIMEQLSYADEVVTLKSGKNKEIREVIEIVEQLRPWASIKDIGNAKMR